jgi:hypothetical protein
MKPRHGYRLIAKTRANAQAAGMALTEWLGLTRKQRKALKRKAKEPHPFGCTCWPCGQVGGDQP